MADHSLVLLAASYMVGGLHEASVPSGGVSLKQPNKLVEVL